MRHYVFAGSVLVVLSGCTAVSDTDGSPHQLTRGEVAAMSKATQDKYCAVLTEVQPDNINEHRRIVANQLLAVESVAITDENSSLVNVKSVRRDPPLSESAVPRGWTLSAPCVVWRYATTTGRLVPAETTEDASGAAMR